MTNLSIIFFYFVPYLFFVLISCAMCSVIGKFMGTPGTPYFLFGLLGILGIFVCIFVCSNSRSNNTSYTPPTPTFTASPSSPVTTDELYRNIETYLRNDQKILAIKYYRETTGVGLVEAKNAVERIENDINNGVFNASMSSVAESTSYSHNLSQGDSISEAAKVEYLEGLKQKLEMGMITKEEYTVMAKRYK